MTHEQIEQAANDRVNSYCPLYADWKEHYKDGFFDGAYWRDAQSPWISVKDRLPDYGEDVIVFDEKYGGVYFNHRSDDPSVIVDADKWRIIGKKEIFDSPHYWMPIPELPTDKTE